MKKLSFLALAAVGLLFTACSDSDSAGKDDPINKDGNGYVAIQINLPTDPGSSTRALNDDFDDGLPTEYAVENAAVFFFDGTSESTATFLSAAVLALPAPVMDVDNDNLTSSYLATAQIDKEITNDLYALVVLNYTNVVNITSTGATLLGPTPLDLGSATTIADINGHITNVDLTGAKAKFFMTNAVISELAGGTVGTPSATKLQTLRKIDKSCIRDTEAEAKLHPAGSIYVERAVAKATISSAVTKIGTSGPAINKIEWAINNTEPTSYLVRNMGTSVSTYITYSSTAFASPNYRMVGHTKLGETAIQPVAELYRTYWCEDPQYSSDATLTLTSSFGNTGRENPQYCYENTFDLDHQIYKNTTRAVIKVSTNGGADFYTVNGGETTYNATDAETFAIANLIANADIVNCFASYATTPYTITTADFDITWTDDPATGQHKVATIDLSTATKALEGTTFNTGFAAAFAALDLTGIAGVANTYVVISKYTGGVVYYEARFQHFANTADVTKDLAPWNTWETGTEKPAAGDVTKAYRTANRENDYLGRYGMVRNNWYDVEITAINKIGYPVDPSASVTPPTTPDDNVNSKYISMKINVLSWAKRTQGWSF